MRAKAWLLVMLALTATSAVWSQGAVGPVLEYSDPLDGSRTNNRGQTILLNFSQVVETGGVIVTRLGTPVTGTTMHGADQSILVFTPAQLLADGTYMVDFSGVRGATGYPVEGAASFTFTVDATPPRVTSSSPAGGQAGVPVDTQISLTFSEALELGAAPAPFTLTGPSGPVPLVFVSENANMNTFTYAPASPLAMATTYTVDYSMVFDLAFNSPTPPATFVFTTAAPPPLTLRSSMPANGQSGVSSTQQIILDFSNDLDSQASSITVRSRTGMMTGTLSIAGSVATFTPATPYRYGVQYTVQFSGIRDIYGQAPVGLTEITFTTEVGELNGSVDPQMVSLTAGERTGVAYLIQNLTDQQVTLRSSVAEFFVDGRLVATVPVPAEVNVPANSVATLASDASINEQIQNAAKEALTDRVVMVRTFTSPPQQVGQAAVSVSIPLVIRIGGSIAGPASVTEVILDVPPDSKTVGQFAEIRGHAFIRGTGTGPVVGTWFVDDQPVETFQVNLTAGFTQEVWTRMSLPTINLGEHDVELRIARPHPVDSGPRRYVVIPRDVGSQSVFLVAPATGVALLPDAVRTRFAWAPMPGASGYEIAFAPSLTALGFDETGGAPGGPLGKLVWTEAMEVSGDLLMLARVPADAAAWTPLPEQYERLFVKPPGTCYWAVRAVYPAQVHGDPTTTSKPRSLLLQPKPAELALISPMEGAVVNTAYPSFEWEAGPAGSIYEFALMFGGRTVFTALTPKTSYTLSELSRPRLTTGQYEWRVSAIRPAEGIVAASSRRTLVVHPPAEAETPGSTEAANGRISQAVLIASIGPVIPLPGEVSQVTISPPSGAVVATQQPLISATYPEAKPDGVLVTLNGVDVTAIAAITPTSLSLQAPGVFSEGDHTVTVVVNTTAGMQLQEASTFTIALPGGTAAASAAPGTPDTDRPRAARPLELDFNWNWRASTEGTSGDDLALDLNLRGQRTWVWSNDSYAAFNFQLSRPGGKEIDLSNFLAQAAFRKDRYKIIAGDIGAAESELTAQGLTHRSFSFVSSAGPLRLSASHTLGKAIQRSSIGRAPDMLLVTVETARSTPQRGIKLAFVDSENDLSGTSSFAGATRSRVLSLSGRAPLGKTGLNLRSEVANSDSTVVTAFGNQDTSGNAFTAAVDGVWAGVGLSTSYRRIGSDYTSAASNTLTNDTRSWTLSANRPLGKYVSTALNYTTYDNVGNSSIPASSLVSRSLDLTMAYPKRPSLTLRFARNDASSAPFVEGGWPADTEESVWSATASYTGRKWNGYLTYSKSNFEDFFDFVEPEVDTPNDRDTDTWSLGFSVQPVQSLRLRADWGVNNVDRWFRPLFGGLPIAGTDDSHQARLQAEYIMSQRLSTTMAWSRSDYKDALGAFRSDFRDFNVRLNYFLKLTTAGGGVVLTGEYRRFRFGGTTAGNSDDAFSVLINDNRLLNF